MGRRKDPEQVLREWVERDLTEAAAAHELPPAFLADEPLGRIADVLTSGHHPVLSGESGVGKTALVYELARRVHEGRGPPALQGRRLLQISLRQRAAGLLNQNQLRPEMQKLVDVVLKRDQELALFFRDFHRAWDFDLEPQFQLLGYRFRGPILCEGERTKLRTMFETTPELEQHFLVINLDEPTPEEMEELLRLWSADQSARRGTLFEPGAQTTALELTHRFLARDRLPRKAVDLLQQVGSLRAEDPEVSSRDVIERFCRNFNVPQLLVDPALTFDLKEVEERFRSRVLGQDEAVRAVVQLIGLIKAGLSDMRRPFGALLLVGPTGVGKTHLAQLLAEYLFGSRERLVRFNMADYQNDRDALVLFGDPDGYSPSQQRGVLHMRLWGHPFAVVLLDEFEKAHTLVHDRFLQLMDEGAFINGAGETVPCRSVILIATSNTGAEVYRRHALGFSAPTDLEALDRELDRRLGAQFRFEFLNRLDHVVHFHPLSRSHIRTIALRELEQLKSRVGLRNRQFQLEVDDAVLDWLAVHGYDPNYGARFLRRTIERHVTANLAETIVRENPASGAALALSVRGNRIVSRVVKDPAAAATRRQAVTRPVGTGAQTKTLDRRTLLRECDSLLGRAGPLRDRLQSRQEAASDLLIRINDPGFWDDAVASREVLDIYRELDVSMQVEGRFAHDIDALAREREAFGDGSDEIHRQGDLKRLARAYDGAAASLGQWEERVADEGPSGIWLVIRSVDPLSPAPEWLEQLVEMELAWSRKLHLTAQVVAYGMQDNALVRVAIEVDGPGAAANLEMEQGIHRLTRTDGYDARIQIHVVPQSAGPTADDSTPEVREIRTQQLQQLGVTATSVGEVTHADLGHSLEFIGMDNAVLSHLLTDLQPVLASRSADTLATARLYAEGGTGARDPRTDAVAPRLKDVLRGQLDVFLDAWRSRSTAL